MTTKEIEADKIGIIRDCYKAIFLILDELEVATDILTIGYVQNVIRVMCAEHGIDYERCFH